MVCDDVRGTFGQCALNGLDLLAYTILLRLITKPSMPTRWLWLHSIPSISNVPQLA